MSESQPTPPESKTTTAITTSKKQTTLPSIITVDSSAHPKNPATKEDHAAHHNEAATSEDDAGPEGTFGQARTPKHANKADHPRAPQDRKESKPQNLSRQFKSASHTEHSYLEQNPQRHQAPPDRSTFGFAPPPPRPFEGRPFGESSAFHAHDSRQSASRMDYYGPPPPMQVSPGRGNTGGDYRYYDHPPRNDFHPRYPAQPVPRFSDHPRGGYSHEGYHGPQPPPRYDASFHPRGPPPAHQYGSYLPPPPPPGAYSSASSGPPPPFHERYAPPPPPYGHHGRPPPYPDHSRERPPNAMDVRYGPSDAHAAATNSGSTFSRAVSSSFDRSVKSRSSDGDIIKPEPTPLNPSSPSLAPRHPSYLPDDSSWRQLNQVTSVDEAVMRDRMDDDPKSRATPPTPADEVDAIHRQHNNHHHPRSSSASPRPTSNSSSLTNSPAEHHHPLAEDGAPIESHGLVKPPPIPTPSKLASLDSLSSVASAQEPIEEPKKKSLPPTSPGSSTASLDLMKCSSGSAGLLNLPHHGRDASLESLPSYRLERKRSREDRGDMDTTTKTSGDEDEIRRAPSDYEMKESEANDDTPPSKRGRRTDNKSNIENVDRKSSPLASPPQSPVGEKLQHPGHVKRQLSFGTSRPHQPQPLYATRSTSHDGFTDNLPGGGGDAYFDKGPSYTYSMDSATSFPRDNHERHSFPPPRPASSSSSTITPMGGGNVQLDGQLSNEAGHREGIGHSLPSWEIHAQDSFGAASTGGGPLMSTFSFTQDYPMLSTSGSNLGYTGENAPLAVVPPQHRRRESYPPIESRNQSFEGGHYHGSFSRTESMDVSYGGGPHHSAPPPPPYLDPYNKPPPSGPFPPHAPSWGTASSSGSGPSHHGHPQGGGPPMQHLIQYRRGPPPYGPGPMMRSFSEDNSGRASPPPGPPPPPPHRMLPSSHPGFQPPPEFVAPHNPHLNRRPPPAVYIMSTSSSSSNPSMNKRGQGAFTWSKEDDSRLTDIMKKYKNPRDWEPIAKEHGRGKS